MTDETSPAMGLSIGATNLAAVTADGSVTRRPFLTLYERRPPEVGVPSENPNLTERGLVMSDFVDRVGNPVGIVATDGSVHRAEGLLAEALRALACTVTGHRRLPKAAIAYPAHWPAAGVDALRAALGRVPEWASGLQPVPLIPDAAAALTAWQANPGLPTRGTIAVCDFGGSGTSITVVDAAEGYRPIGATVRHKSFSGKMIDQALLDQIMADLSVGGSLDVSGTWGIGSLSRLRAECRSAKERLSASTVTELTASLPGSLGDTRLTSAELDDAIRQPLNGVVAVVQETLQRNGIPAANLVAVALMGGVASVPQITTRLARHLRVPVITQPQPHLTAATGAALRAARGPAGRGETAVHPPRRS